MARRLAEASRVRCRLVVSERMAAMPKKHPTDLKEWAVRTALEHVAEHGSATASARAVGAQLGIPHNTLAGGWSSPRRWREQARVTTVESEEARALEKEVRRLRERRTRSSVGRQSSSRGSSTRTAGDRLLHRLDEGQGRTWAGFVYVASSSMSSPKRSSAGTRCPPSASTWS
jgi:hypothetical protein